VRLPHIAPSLGGVESLIEQPTVISYWDQVRPGGGGLRGEAGWGTHCAAGRGAAKGSGHARRHRREPLPLQPPLLPCPPLPPDHPNPNPPPPQGPEKRAEIGIKDSLVRFSVGVESLEDIWADVEQALESIS
jgi:hypothetical protein